MTRFSEGTERALCACGRSNVFVNDGNPTSVAIRRDPITSPGEKWIIGSGETQEEAGRKAAAMFATDLEARAKDLAQWASRIRLSIFDAPHDPVEDLDDPASMPGAYA